MPRGERSFLHDAISLVAATIVALVLIGLLWYLIDVLFLVFAGVLLAVFLRAPTDWLSRRTGVGAGPALAIVLALLTALLAAGAWWFGNRLADQAVALSQTLPQTFESLRTRLEAHAWARPILHELTPRGLLSGRLHVLGGGLSVINASFGVAANLVIVAFLALFFAAQPQLYVRGFLHLVPHAARERVHEVLRVIGGTLRWWVLAQLFLMAVVAVLTGIGLYWLGMPLSLALGMLAGFLTFIPFIGPVLSAIPAVLIALTHGITYAGDIVLLYVGVQSLESYVLEPLVQQRAVYLPPALILMTQVALGVLVGIVGVLFATPFTATALVAVQMLYVHDVLGDVPLRTKQGAKAEKGGARRE